MSNPPNLADLQAKLAYVDMLSSKPPNGRSDLLEVLLIKNEPIKLKMYQEPGHKLGHFHVDYGRKFTAPLMR